MEAHELGLTIQTAPKYARRTATKLERGTKGKNEGQEKSQNVWGKNP